MTSSHHNWGIVGYKMGPFYRFLNMLGYTQVFDNPDSWEGWHWGATHTYGFFWRLGMPEQYDLLEDSLKNAEMIVFWSNDPDSTRGTYTGQESAMWRLWLKEKGVKMVFIDPFYNYTAAAMDGKWIPIRMGSGTALAMAIAFVWITENTYDRQYVEEPNDRVRGVQAPHPRRGRRSAQDAGVGRSGMRGEGAGDPWPWPASGPPSGPCSLEVRGAGKGARAGRRTPRSGRG